MKSVENRDLFPGALEMMILQTLKRADRIERSDFGASAASLAEDSCVRSDDRNVLHGARAAERKDLFFVFHGNMFHETQNL